MSAFRGVQLILLSAMACFAATLGTAVPVVGGVADIVLDEARGRLYLVNSNRSQVEVYSTTQRRFLNPIRTEALPLSAAISRTGKILYVTSHTGAALNLIDLDTLEVVSRVSLPARPEGVAVGADERVLISTIGTGQNNLFNVLLVFDPNATTGNSLAAVAISPPPPQNPLLPPTAGRPFLSSRSQLRASDDGRFIVGVNIPNNNSRTVFVYEVVSGTVLRSRTVNGVSSAISVAPDGSKFMAGLTLFDLNTLEVLAQQNAANAPYTFLQGSNFNLQQNQGGSVFAPDDSLLYSAFNFAPVQNPPARPNVSQLMLNDPDNLLIHMGLQLTENLAGKMVITSDGGTIYAVSESGFLILPLSALSQNPIARPESPVVLLTNDQCGVTVDRRSTRVEIQNDGRGRMTATAQLLPAPPTGPGGLGGVGGPGGGAPGGGVIIIIPPGAPDGGAGRPVVPPQGGGQQGGQAAAIAQSAPQVRVQQMASGPVLEFTFGSNAARALGTVSPTHQFLIQSNEAVNIPPVVQVFQNNRDAESMGEVMPVPVRLSANERLEDMVLDASRGRVYIANSGMNRVEVFDTRARTFLSPIKVGQLPRSLAIAPDGLTLFVANTGGENISIIDLEKLEVTGRVRFPPTPFNTNIALVTPSVIAAGQRGPQLIMSNGSIWKIVGNEAIPRPLSPGIGALTVPAPRTMVATPNGEFILLLAGNGFAYLYDALADEFVQSRQVITPPITGYYGPVAAGPRGQYFLVNGLVLNQALTRIGTTATLPPALANRPISAVAAVSATTYARFAQPVLANQNALPATTPSIELVDVNTGSPIRAVAALEGPLSRVAGNQRANVAGRTLAMDPSGSVAYAITTSGLSVIPLETVAAASRPAINPGGAVNVANYQTSIAQGSLISIFGRGLGAEASSGSTPLPTVLGGTCVTLSNRPLPLLMTSNGQINAQIPPDLAPGRYPLVVRSIDRNAASLPQQITVGRFAPAVFVDPATGQAAIFHPDGRPVDQSSPAKRDHFVVLYALGLGPTRGGRVIAGQPAPDNPLAETEKVEVFFGDHRYREAEMIVEWSGLTPGFIGLYQINVRVPGDRIRGKDLPVAVRIGGVLSSTEGELAPKVSVD